MIEKEKLEEIVGVGSVSYEQAILERYSRDLSFANPVKPACVVRLANAGQMQKIVNLANETLTPLVPVSSGAPHFRGDTVPGTGGAIIVDLSAMKKIIRVDRAHRVAMVEPGVTFEELIPELEKAGLRLNMPLLPRKTKTVVGSMLEREPVIMPKYHWDIADPLACVEVIFGNGELFRTGQAAGPGTLEEQWAAGAAQKTPYGPGPAQWYRIIQGSQGTMGMVTWASLRCELLPELEEPFMVSSANIVKLFELTHWLVRLRLANECFILNNTGLASIMTEKWPGEYQVLKDSLAPWVLFYNVAGYHYYPAERVSSLVKGITEYSRRAGVESQKAAGNVSAADLLKAVQRPSAEPYWKLRSKGACQDIFFITTYDKLEGQISLMYKLATESGCSAADLGVYIQPIVQGSNLHCEFNLFYNPASPAEVNRIKSLTTSAINSLMATGAFFSRPYDTSARMIINRDAAYVDALTRVKAILDPNRVMNPGKLCF
jgi:FAD/FMN-containing dehydrogenase